METKSETFSASPPALIPSITAGFEAIANHIHIILLPVLLDLLLWFGPRLRVFDLMVPRLERAADELAELTSAELLQGLGAAQSLWQQFFEHFNLAVFLRGFPVGVPSLLAGEGPLETPLGATPIVEIDSLAIVLLSIGIFFLLGTSLGALYFHLIARYTGGEKESLSLGNVGWQSLQSVVLTLALLVIMALFAIPSAFLIGIFVWISPALAQIAVFLLVIVLIWLLVPLLFAPHGIYTSGLTAMTSILTSVRLVRFYLPGTGLFLLVIVLISQGLDLLWRIPPHQSWMALVGILGHAFISTSLFAASFAYYRGGLQWMQANVQRFKTANSGR